MPGAHDVNTGMQLFWFFLQFRGRISRAPFLLGFLLILVVQLFCLYRVVMAAPDLAMEESLLRLLNALPANDAQRFWMEVFSIIGLVTAFPMIALHVKRFHDFGLSGLLAFLAFMPVLNLVTVLALSVTRGTPGPNKFGARTNDVG